MYPDQRIQNSYKLTQGILSWYYDNEREERRFEQNRAEFLEKINRAINNANTNRMTANVSDVYERVYRTAEDLCFGYLKLHRGRKPNKLEFEKEWNRRIPPTIPPRYSLIEERIGYHG
jgi:hypothetical protein